MEITICHYQQLYGRREMREDYWFFVGKRASIFVVKLLHISKLKGIYWPAFEDLSSYSRFSDCWLILIMRNFTSLFYKRLWEYLLWRLFLKFEVDSLKNKTSPKQVFEIKYIHHFFNEWILIQSSQCVG